MIKILEVKNFKSIKQLKLECKRLNVFIGEPNTGKSNILETLGIFSYGRYYDYVANLLDFVRFERVTNLFYDENIGEQVIINLDEANFKFELLFKEGSFLGNIYAKEKLAAQLRGNYDNLGFVRGQAELLTPFKFYKFRVLSAFTRPESDFLLPPYGPNLMSLILARKELRSLANQMFHGFGFRLALKPQEQKIEVFKQIDDVIVSYPYSLASDTLQRIIFHLVAVLSNKDSVLAFEEPESHAFPYYTKYFAENVAQDDRGNQYFISTHNPYLLLPLLEKAPKDDLAVFITYFEDYQTKVKTLSEEEKNQIMEIDIFSNLDRFLQKVA